MAVTLANTWNLGLAGGTALTGGVGGNTGAGGNFFDTITVGAGAAATSETTPVYRGSGSGKFLSTATSSAASANWTTSIGTAVAASQGRALVNLTTIGTATDFLRVRGAGVQSFRVRINATGNIELRNSGNTLLSTSTTTATAATYIMIRWNVAVGASATGIVYINTNLTADAPDETLTANAANFGTSNMDEVNFGGPIVATVNVGPIFHDDSVFTDQGRPGPPTQTITISESNVSSDSIARTLILPRSSSETNVASDSIARTLILPRSPAESVSASDAVARQTILPRGVSESTSTNDSVARVTTASRSVTESVSTSDSVSRTTIANRIIAQSLSTSDSIARISILARSAVESNVASDSVARVSVLYRSIAETLVTSDSVTAVYNPASLHRDLQVKLGLLRQKWSFDRVNEPQVSGAPVFLDVPELKWNIGRVVSLLTFSSATLEYVRIPVTAVSAGAYVNPTTDVVNMAFLSSSTATPVAGDWKAATWDTIVTPPFTYVVQCLVGIGGTVTLTAGTYYVWVKITDNPEIVVRPVGVIVVV